MRPIARHAVAAFILCGIAWARWPTPTKSLPPTCHDWIEVRRGALITLKCGVAHIAAELAACASQIQVRRGDRVQLLTPCRADLMGPRRRLALGLRLDVNAASTGELTAVSGIGPAMARRIVAKRPYARLQDLEGVRGIGPKRRRRFAKSLRIGPERVLWP